MSRRSYAPDTCTRRHRVEPPAAAGAIPARVFDEHAHKKKEEKKTIE